MKDSSGLQLPDAKGRSGWPWVNADQTRLREPEGPLPSVTIITPSLNQADFIEETIRSVVLQDYPLVEYIVMDGGSTDETSAILQRYSAWIDYWESVPDKGQANAVNK